MLPLHKRTLVNVNKTINFYDLEHFGSKKTIVNLDTQKIAPDFGDPPPQKKQNSESLKPGYMSNFLLAMAMQFQQIIALPSHAQNVLRWQCNIY